MESEPTTLSEFADTDERSKRDDAPTPAENAADIQHLVDAVGRLTEQVGRVTDELEQRDEQDEPTGDDPEPAGATYVPADLTEATERMFQ